MRGRARCRFGGIEYKTSRKPSTLKELPPKDGRLLAAEKDGEEAKPSAVLAADASSLRLAGMMVRLPKERQSRRMPSHWHNPAFRLEPMKEAAGSL